PTSSTTPSPATSGWARPAPTTRPSAGPPGSPRPTGSSGICRTATAPGSASAAPGSPRASASGSRWPAPSCGTRRSCCSTSPPPTWTRRTPPRSAARSGACCATAPPWSSRTTPAGPRWSTRWSRCAPAGSPRRPPDDPDRPPPPRHGDGLGAADPSGRLDGAAAPGPSCSTAPRPPAPPRPAPGTAPPDPPAPNGGSAMSAQGTGPATVPDTAEAAADPIAAGRGRGPLLRMIRLARPRGSRFALGVLLGGAAPGSGVALLGVSAWLLAMAAQHPPITALSVAIVATRALGVTRGLTRYLERLVTHDAAFRTLADVRVRVYERLARTEPIRRFRSGDLVSRLVNDTEATQDLLIRGLTPPLVAVVAGGAAAAVCTALLVPGGALLAAGLLLAGLAVPLAAAALGRGPGRRQAEARGALSTSLVDALHGAPDLIAYGAMDRAVRRVEEADAELTRVARRDAGLLGFGAGATALITGLTVWGSLFLGVTAVQGGTLGPVPFAVLVLTTLAAFEIVAPLPAVAARLGAMRAAGERLFGVLDTPPLVHEPDERRTLPDPLPDELRIRGLEVCYGPDEPWALRGVDIDVRPGEKVAVLGPSGAGKSTLAAVLFRFRDPDRGTVELGGADITDYPRDEVRRAVGG